MLAGAIEAPIIHKTFRSYSERELRRSIHHHRELIDAFRAHDGAWARSIMSSHIYAAKNSLLGEK
jgi:DNA-binding GntR family transcriptional regulator